MPISPNAPSSFLSIHTDNEGNPNKRNDKPGREEERNGKRKQTEKKVNDNEREELQKRPHIFKKSSAGSHEKMCKVKLTRC